MNKLFHCAIFMVYILLSFAVLGVWVLGEK